MAKLSGITATNITYQEAAAPSTPAATKWVSYFKTDGQYYKDDAGVETGPLASSSGAVNTGTPYEVDYVEFTSPVNITATAEASGNTVVTSSSVAFDGSTIALIEFYTPFCRPDASTNATLKLYLFVDGSSIGQIVQKHSAAATSANDDSYTVRRLTPSNASHTYSVRGIVSTGTGVVSAGAGGSGNIMPGFIRISKLTA